MPYLEYAVYADTIAATLCINRDRPELDCQGKCYRNKQLAEKFAQGQQQSSDAGLPSSQAPVLLKIAPFLAPERFAFPDLESEARRAWQVDLTNLARSQYWGDIVLPPPRS